MTAEFAGSALYAIWVHAGGTLVLNTDFRNFNYTPGRETIDSTAGSDSSRQYIDSFKTGTARCTILGKTTDGTAVVGPLSEGTNGTLIYGPAGTASGYLKRTVPAKSQGVTDNVVYNDVVTYDVSWLQNGDRTDGTW